MLIVVYVCVTFLCILSELGSKYLLCIVLLLTAHGKFSFSGRICISILYVFTYKMYLLFLLYLLQQATYLEPTIVTTQGKFSF